MEAVGATGAVEVLSFTRGLPVVFKYNYLILILEVQCGLLSTCFHGVVLRWIILSVGALEESSVLAKSSAG